MAIPHIIQMRLIKQRLKNLDGRAKLKEIKKVLDEMPKYNTGPYGEIRKWVRDQATKTKTKSEIKHQDWLGVKKQGDRQLVLVGKPSVGKSSLIQKLSGVQTKIASYEFTTLEPIPAAIKINGATFQIVDLPGLIKGATEDVGGGKRLIGIVKQTDGILLMSDLSKPIDELDELIGELNKSEINKPTIIIGNKIDLEKARKGLQILKKKFPKLKVIGISTITEEGFEELKKEIWNLSGLIRIFPNNENEPMILDKSSTVKDFAEKVHKDLIKKFRHAIVSGTSTKFDNQQVGISHILEDMDKIELVLER
ncbi:MAG: GTP-binding protein [archaeon]|nr:GTP-binding protein [archaeon]MCR4324056.1 GTP-binding protein [Nanoarchaeota archaeon]